MTYVAEPGGSAKLSKRKLDKYLKQKDFATLFQLGDSIAKKANLQTTPETFNPVVVDFYRETGFLPQAILNYLLLLGWSLDSSTEHFSLEDAVKHFSLERVNKAPASFDPQKLLSFQARWMSELDVKKKVAMVLPYLQQAGWISTPPPCDAAEHITRVVTAASDRIKVAGDILQFDEFFKPDDAFEIDVAAFKKRILDEAQACELLKKTKQIVADCNPWNTADLESKIKEMVEASGAKLGTCINALRIALTGKPSGVGVFDAFAILGQESAGARIDRAIAASSANS